ncbi:MAG: hypothetical protein OEV88_07295 [Gammaproteobacteria bacterium]|jgi:hypothetical protein|nr:hypothetical protein [Gammaproteobacteria bacterium]
MNYTCKDCSYRGKTSGQDGSCLACGSFNLARKPVPKENPRSGKVRITLLIGLWIYLIALIIWKLNH